jgi:hypothetical protein
LMQQYEMHQRQLQQMQAFHEQQEQNRPMIQAHQHMMGSASFDTSGDYNISSPVSGHGGPSMHLVGNNPMLIRVSIPGQQSQPDHYGPRSSSRAMIPGGISSATVSGQFRPYAQAVTQDQGGAFVTVQAGESEGTHEAWTIPPASSFVSKDDSPLSPGRMNPQATAFAPAYSTGTSPCRFMSCVDQHATHSLTTFCAAFRPIFARWTTANAILWICAIRCHRHDVLASSHL